MGDQPAEYLQGVVDRLTFHSAESGYTVARFPINEVVTGGLYALLKGVPDHGWRVFSLLQTVC